MSVEQLQEWLSEIASLSSEEKAGGVGGGGSSETAATPSDATDGSSFSKSTGPKSPIRSSTNSTPGTPKSPQTQAQEMLRSLRENAQMVGEMLNFIRENVDDEDSFEPICTQLLTLYQLGGHTRVFVLQFVPGFLWAYLEGISKKQRKNLMLLETLLLALYSEEIMETVSPPEKRFQTKFSRALDVNSGSPMSAAKRNGTEDSLRRKVEVVKVPMLTVPSIYHEPANISQSVLTDHSLNRLNPPSASGSGEETGNIAANSSIQIGPFPSANEITPENRYMILTRILRAYNVHLAQYHVASLKTMCQLAGSVTRWGFHFPESELVEKVLGAALTRSRGRRPRDFFQSMDEFSDKPRLPLHPVFLQEMFNSVYYAMFNGLEVVGLRALDAIHQRAHFDLSPNLLLLTNSVINSLLENPSGTPQEGPMGIRVSTSGYSFADNTPSSSGSDRAAGGGGSRPVNRRLITNASLRIKKMPEDIPLKSPIDQPSASPPSARKKALTVIAEATSKAKEHLKHHKEEKEGRDSQQNSPKAGRAHSGGHVEDDPESERLLSDRERSETGGSAKKDRKFLSALTLGPIKPSKSEMTMDQFEQDHRKKEIQNMMGNLLKKGQKKSPPSQMDTHKEAEEPPPIQLDDIFVQPSRESSAPSKMDMQSFSSSSSSHTSIQTVIYNPNLSAGSEHSRIGSNGVESGRKGSSGSSGGLGGRLNGTGSEEEWHSQHSSLSGSYTTPRERTPDPHLSEEEITISTPRIESLCLGPKPPSATPSIDTPNGPTTPSHDEHSVAAPDGTLDIIIQSSKDAIRHADSSDNLSD